MTRRHSNYRGILSTLVLLAGVLSLAGCKPTATSETAGTADAVVPVSDSEQVSPETKIVADSDASEKADSPMPADEETSKSAEPKGEAKTTAAKSAPTRDTTSGWWRLLFSLPAREDDLVHDFSAGFVKIGKTDEGYAVEEMRANQIISPAELSEKSTATEESVVLDFEYEELRFNFTGTLQEAVIRGNLQFLSPPENAQRQNIVRLVPVKETDVDEETLEEADLGPTQDAAGIQEVATSEDPIAALAAGQEKWAGNPAYYFAWQSVIGRLGELELDAAGVKSAVEGYQTAAKPWGERAVGLAGINAAISLMATGTELDYAEKLLAEASETSPKLMEIWSDQIAAAKQIAAVASAWHAVQSGDTEQGLNKLRELHAASPTSELATYRLASAEREHGTLEKAQQLFASLEVSPRMFSPLASIATEEGFVEPREAAEAIYKERTGSQEGFESYLLSVYRDTVTNFIPDDEKNRPASESNRVVLLELFTGAMCPPCVAADIGTEAIERSFPHDDVIVLRYHLHIPGPDPLATTATEARQEYYASDIQGTPTLLINGTTPPFPVGGMYGRAELVYRSLAGLLETLVMEPTPAEVDLSATIEGDKLHIVAKGSTKEKSFDTVKLRIVIAENEIQFPAPNGILEHSMIVRSMPGGPEGIASEKGGFTFDKTISLTELREEITSYLDTFENRHGPVFPSRPGSLRRLSVVAFLQDDVTHEVLQSAVVPIEQDIVLPPSGAVKEKEGEKKDEKKAAEDKADSESPEPKQDAAASGPALKGNDGEE